MRLVNFFKTGKCQAAPNTTLCKTETVYLEVSHQGETCAGILREDNNFDNSKDSLAGFNIICVLRHMIQQSCNFRICLGEV